MKYLLFTCCMLLNGYCFAQAPSEPLQVGTLLATLQSQNSNTHAEVYASYEELLSGLLMNYQPAADVATLRAHPERLQQYDPAFNADITKDFNRVILKGVDSGLHWKDLIMAGYELKKMILPKELTGLDKIMEMRMQGYIFVQDLLTRRRYIISLKDMVSVKDKWYGGHVLDIFEAENIDEFLKKQAKEKKEMKRREDLKRLGIVDTVLAKIIKEKEANKIKVDEDEEEPKPMLKDISERKLYTGTFDKETEVELYIRGLKGPCKEASCSWEGMYKFADQDDYIKLIITKTPDGNWVMTEDPDVGLFELKLNGEHFTGSWTSLKDRTEYEVELTEKKEVKGKKLQRLDDTLDNGYFAQ